MIAIRADDMTCCHCVSATTRVLGAAIAEAGCTPDLRGAPRQLRPTMS